MPAIVSKRVWPGPPAWIERPVLLALGLGTAVAVLFAAENRLLPRENPTTFALTFLRFTLPFYLLILAAPLAVLGFLFRGRPAWVRGALGIVALGSLLALLGLNAGMLRPLFNLGGPVRFQWLAPAAFVVAVTGLTAAGGIRPERRLLPRAFALLAPVLAAVAFWPPPPPAPPPRERRVPAAAACRLPGLPLLLFGIDAADWTIMEPLLRRGELPVIASLRAQGAYGPLRSFTPTRSPAIWTTIATGQPPEVHGIEGFAVPRVVGVEATFREVRLPRGLGYEALFRWLGRTHRLGLGPVLGTSRRVPAFWELASAEGRPVSVVNWWATWPAEPVLGAIVSERVHYYRTAARGTRPEARRLTYPPELHAEILPLVMTPEQVGYAEARRFMDVTPEEFAAMRGRPFKGKTIESEFPHLYSMFETDRRVALHLIARTRRQFGTPSSLLVLLRIVDIACHSSLRESELVADRLGAPAEDIRRFGRVVSEAYRSADRALGEMMQAMGEANVVVVSDHGFPREGDLYHHQRAPAGIFLAKGPAFRPGPVADLGLYDMLPLLAALEGLEVAEDLPGRVPEEVFAPGFLASRPVRRVATYGRRRDLTVAQGSPEADEEMLERLRALGYVQ